MRHVSRPPPLTRYRLAPTPPPARSRAAQSGQPHLGHRRRRGAHVHPQQPVWHVPRQRLPQQRGLRLVRQRGLPNEAAHRSRLWRCRGLSLVPPLQPEHRRRPRRALRGGGAYRVRTRCALGTPLCGVHKRPAPPHGPGTEWTCPQTGPSIAVQFGASPCSAPNARPGLGHRARMRRYFNDFAIGFYDLGDISIRGLLSALNNKGLCAPLELDTGCLLLHHRMRAPSPRASSFSRPTQLTAARSIGLRLGRLQDLPTGGLLRPAMRRLHIPPQRCWCPRPRRQRGHRVSQRNVQWRRRVDQCESPLRPPRRADRRALRVALPRQRHSERRGGTTLRGRGQPALRRHCDRPGFGPLPLRPRGECPV